MEYVHLEAAASELSAAADNVLEAAIAPETRTPRRDRQEHAITSEIVGAARERLSGFTAGGIRWEAHSLSDRGPGSQEARFGADLVGVIGVRLPELEFSKGFLVQAKRGSRPLRVDKDLRGQCADMLDLTPASFVWLYDSPALYVYPALTVAGARGAVDDFPAWTHDRFFREFVACFVGDRALGGTTEDHLEALRERANARAGFLMFGRSADPHPE